MDRKWLFVKSSQRGHNLSIFITQRELPFLCLLIDAIAVHVTHRSHESLSNYQLRFKVCIFIDPYVASAIIKMPNNIDNTAYLFSK